MSFSKLQKVFLDKLTHCQSVLEMQSELIDEIANRIIESFDSEDGVFHVFGSGHSHILSYELFHRAGGLVPVNPIFAEETMPHRGPRSVRECEREPGFAKSVFESNDIREGEVVFIVSNSGINSYPIEFAEHCNKGGAITVAITSVAHSKAVPARSGKKLFEVCQYVVDTGVPPGDSVVPLPKNKVNVGPLSSLMSILFGELLVVRVAELMESQGKVAPVLKSANSPGGDEFNKELEARYSRRITLLDI